MKRKKICEKRIESKRLKERYQNKRILSESYVNFRTGEVEFYDWEVYPNEKDGFYRHDLRTMQERKQNDAANYSAFESQVKLSLRKKRINNLPDDRDDVKSFTDEKCWKSNSKRRNQWY